MTRSTRTQWVEVSARPGRHLVPPHRQMSARPSSTAEHAPPTDVSGPRRPGLESDRRRHPGTQWCQHRYLSHPPAGAVVESGIQPFTSGSVSSGTILVGGSGSFPSATGLTGENYNVDGRTTSLQLNTDSNLSNSAVTALCKSTATRPSCTGWVQFGFVTGRSRGDLVQPHRRGGMRPSSSWIEGQRRQLLLRGPQRGRGPRPGHFESRET